MKEIKEIFQKSVFNKRITVIGLGLSGKAVSILANHLGAIVYASDSGSSEEITSNATELMHQHHIALETGIHSSKIYDSDLWIISPGVSADSKIVNEAFKKNIPIVSEIEFASWFTNSPIIGITGSNGNLTGYLRVAGDITAYYSSDRRLKDNIQPIESPLEKVSKLGGYSFDWIPTEGIHINEGHDIGVVAQEIEKIAPEAVVTRDNGFKAVRYEKLIPILIQAIKELDEKVNKLG